MTPPLPAFLLIWAVMMAAMMLPSVAPTAILWSNGIAQSSSGAVRLVRSGAFFLGYVVAWTAYGLAAYAAGIEVAATLQRWPQSGRWIGAGIFLLAAVYQLTPLKRACLSRCRSPFAALMHYAAFSKTARDLRVGLHHGLYCIGCCWALMAVLVAAGMMNVAAMAAIAAIIFVEKRWRRGESFATALSIVFVALAVLAVLRPQLFPGLQPAMPE